MQPTPFGLNLPYWIEDENFDLEYHVRHIALPRPGDWREFCIQASRIHARPLNLNRPLWEIYVMGGLDGIADLPAESFALLVKVHHAAVRRSMSIAAPISRRCCMTPLNVLRIMGRPRRGFPRSPPCGLSLLARTAFNAIASPLNAARKLSRVLTSRAPTARRLLLDLLFEPQSTTITRFNSVVSPHRVFDARRFKLDDFKRIRTLAPGATVNDAVLAVCAGSLRRYLAGKEELPATSLTAALPIYVRLTKNRRKSGAGKDHPDVSWESIEIATHIADPVNRREAIRGRTASSKVLAEAIGAKELTARGAPVPTAALALASKLLARESAQRGNHTPLANCSVINVPGSPVPLYLNGARLTFFSAILPIADGMGLALAVTSCNGEIVISTSSCRHLLPDPDVFSQCVCETVEKYLGLAAKSAQTRRAEPVKSAAGPASAHHKSTRPRRSAQPDATAPRVERGGRRPPTEPPD